MRRAAKTDANHSEIIRALRKLGALVHDTARLGGGFPDLVVGHRNRLWLVEVKDGRAVPSARRLTAAENEFAALWAGHWRCVESLEDCVNLLSER